MRQCKISEDAKMTGPTMEDITDDYFASMSPIASKIIEEKRKCKEKNKKNWERLTQDEKDSLLDAWFIDPELKMRYEIRLHGKLPSNKDAPPESFPRLKVQGGAKTVHYTEHEHDEEGSQSKGTTSTWKDEFSGPFSWETKCQQELPMISPVAVTAASNRSKDADYSENRLSLGVDTTDESCLIASASSKSKGKEKEAKRVPDYSEKPDKTRVSRKDSKKREKESGKATTTEDNPTPPMIHKQPMASPTPFINPSLDLSLDQGLSTTVSDKNGKLPRREKSDKAKLPKPHSSGKMSPRRETSKQKDRRVDQEGLIPAKGGEERSLGGINLNFTMDPGATEVDRGVSVPSSSLPGSSSGSAAAPKKTATFALVGSPPPKPPPPSESSVPLPSPPPSATSQASEAASAGGGKEEEGAAFDFLLSW